MLLVYLLLCRPSEQVQILVPGAGLGRLAFEIAKRGYSCQGNEFSLFMLFASNFVLNKYYSKKKNFFACLLIPRFDFRCQGVETFRVYPWTQQFVNTLSAADVTRGSTFPDLDPSSLPRHAQFSMAAGDFLEVRHNSSQFIQVSLELLFFFKVYTEANTWDCIATCFFIDCANNIVSFIETIFKILKSGSLSSNHVELAPSINDSFIFDRWRLDQFGPIALSLFGHPGWEFNRTHLRNGQWLQYITFQFHSTHTLLIDQRNCARIRVRHRSNVLPCWL